MALRVSSRFPAKITVDGEELSISIKRLDPQEASRFKRSFSKTAMRAELARPSGTPEELDAKEQAEDKDELTAKEFIVKSLTDFVVLGPGQLFEDDKEVTAGADFARLYGGRESVLTEVLQLIFLENTLSEEQKATWRSQLAPFVPTPQDVAQKMVSLAQVTPEDTVVDLGSGTGEVCIAAAQAGAKRVIGWETDEGRVHAARAAAEAAGVGSICEFILGDAMEAKLSEATVVTLYLLPASNLKLKPKLRQELPAGARVVSHAFTMGTDWPCEAHEEVPLPEGVTRAHSGQRQLYLYKVTR